MRGTCTRKRTRAHPPIGSQSKRDGRSNTGHSWFVTESEEDSTRATVKNGSAAGQEYVVMGF